MGRSGTVVGLFRHPCTCPDLDSHFAGVEFGGESISLRGHTYLRRLPLGGKLSPKVTDEGAIGLPNGAGEKFRWGDSRHPLLCVDDIGNLIQTWNRGRETLRRAGISIHMFKYFSLKLIVFFAVYL